MRILPRLLHASTVLSILLIAATAFGQGRRGDRGGLLSTLRRGEIRRELDITAEQAARLDDLQAKSAPDKAFYDGFMERLSAAESEDQRKPIRDEMAAAEAKLRDDAEAEAGQVLTPEQLGKVTDRLIADRGISALSNPAVREQLGVSPDQAAKLDEIQKQREEATKDLFTGTDPNRFETFRKEWDAKPIAVLNEAQRSRWDTAVAARTQPTAAPPAGRDADEDRRADRPTEVAAAQLAETRSEPAPPAAEPAGEAAGANDPVASFGGASDAPAQVDRSGERLLTFNFRYAPWSEVLKLFADYANLTLDLDDVPPGTFNYYDDRQYTPTQALDVLNGYLLQKGYVLVRRDNFLVCLNVDEGIPPNLVPNITADELPKRGQNELLNVVFSIEGANPTDVAKEVELLLGPQGKVVPLGTSKSLAVTDIGSNLRRIDRLLSAVSAAALGDLSFKSYPLKHLDPRDAESIVKNQLGLSTGVANVSSSSAFDQYRRDRGDRGREEERRPPTPAAPATQTRVAGDDRTRSLLVTATAAQHKIAEEVLRVTDVPAESDGRGRRNNEPYLKVYSLDNSDPQEVVKTLDVLMPGIVVNEDGRNEKIHILAPQAVHEEVETLLRQLDGEGTGSGSSAVTVIPLATTDPYNAAATIRSLFAGDGEDAPIVEADSYGRRLLVRGTSEQVAQVKALLLQLGEDGTGKGGNRYSTGPVRTVPLGGRDPEEMIPLLQRLWEASGDTPLRIVPNGPGTIIERRELGRPERDRPSVPLSRDEPAPASNFNIADPLPTAAAEAANEPEAAPADSAQEPAADAVEPAAEEAPAEEPAPEEGAAEETDQPKPDAPVAVTIQGGNLVLSSEDEESLDRLEDLVGRLGQVVPPRTKWTVFYLRSADATETAMLLEQLFPTSDVSTTAIDGGLFSSLTSGLSSFGGSVIDAAGLDSLGLDAQTLRIIPEVRSNSLFISGPPDKIAEVEQVLDVLDATDLPDSLRARVPRMIEVRHADVEEVASIIREVYKDYLQPANMAGGANPLAMLLGGGGGGGGGGRGGRNNEQDPGQIRLTVGVDAATSKLIVSANDELFRQVEQLVGDLDAAALRANRTVRVVALENADAAMVQNTLGSLIPKVRTSSTAQRRAGTDNQQNGSNNQQGQQSGDRQGGGDNDDQDRIRRALEERMRERIREQAGGGAGGGDRGRGGDRGGRGGFGGFGGGGFPGFGGGGGRGR